MLEIINIISNLILTIAFGVGVFYSIRTLHAIHDAKDKKDKQISEFQEAHNDQMILLQKETLKYELMAKNYWEIFIKGFSKSELIDITELQRKLEIAIAEEDYLKADAIQKEIDKVTKPNK